MSRVQTSFAVTPNSTAVTTLEVGGRTGSLRKAFTTSDEDEDGEEELRPLKPASASTTPNKKAAKNNSQSSTSDYHSDENPNLLPLEHRELPSFRLENYNR